MAIIIQEDHPELRFYSFYLSRFFRCDILIVLGARKLFFFEGVGISHSFVL